MMTAVAAPESIFADASSLLEVSSASASRKYNLVLHTHSDFVTVQYGMYVNRPHRCNEYNG